MDNFKNLPSDIILDILSRLPTESILECKLVSKTWNTLIHHPSFSKMHFYYFSNAAVDSGESGFIALTYEFDNGNESFWYFEYNQESTQPIQRIKRVNLTSPVVDYGFVGTCNGLICFARGPSVCVCNPVTREYVVLPEIIKTDSKSNWRIKFGYASSTGEYKIVGIYTAETEFVTVCIYTLGSGNGWRELGNFSFKSSQEWGQDSDTWDNKLGVLDGILSYAAYLDVEGDEDECIDKWLLKKKNDIHGKKDGKAHHSLGWTKEFSIDDSELLAVTKSDGVLTYSSNYLNIYDTKTSTSKMLVIFKRLLSQVYPHRNALVLESVKIEEKKGHEKLQKYANPKGYIYI